VNNLDHKSNFWATISIAFLSLSVTEQISFIVTMIVLFFAGLSNYYSYKKNKRAHENEKRKSKLMDKYEE